MTAAYVASSTGVLNLFEYGGFHLQGFWGERLLFRYGGEQFKQGFLNGAMKFAADFAARICEESKCIFYVDSTPGNLLIAPQIIQALPEALFVLVLRQPAGVIESLEESFINGHSWAGANLKERAELWRAFYAYALALPREQTVTISYDALCQKPDITLSTFCAELRKFVTNFEPDLKALAVPYNGGSECRTIAVRGTNGFISRSIEPFDADRWARMNDDRVLSIIDDVRVAIKIRYNVKF